MKKTTDRPRVQGPLLLRVTFYLSVIFIGGTVLGTVVVVLQALLAGRVEVVLPTQQFWPSVHPAVTITDGPPAEVASGGFTSATVQASGLGTTTRLLLAAGHLVQGITLTLIGIAVATVCSRLGDGNPFAKPVTRSVRLAAGSLIIGGLSWQVLWGIGGMRAAGEVLTVTGWTIDNSQVSGEAPTSVGWPVPGGFTVDFWPIWVGLALLAVTATFRYGETVRRDNERLQRDTDGLV